MLAERYAIPNGVATAELIIKNSRFIGTVGHARAAELARAFIATVSHTYADASHHAWAYRLQGGPQGEIGSSDDGEPGGTAGRPMLAVLEGSGLHEVVAVGTRYFGGVKLGTGGLVRAYSGCVHAALAALPTQEMVLHHTARVEVDYALYGQLTYHLPRLGVKVEEPTFADRVSLTLAAPSEALGEIARLLQELTNGQTMLTHWDGCRYDPSN